MTALKECMPSPAEIRMGTTQITAVRRHIFVIQNKAISHLIFPCISAAAVPMLISVKSYFK